MRCTHIPNRADHAWNQKSQIRSNRASASLPAARNGACLKVMGAARDGSYPRPRNFQICRSSSAGLSVRRSAHTGGTTSTVRSSVKQSPAFWTENSNRLASVRIRASRSLCPCVALSIRHPRNQCGKPIVDSHQLINDKHLPPLANFEISGERCHEATNNAFGSCGLGGRGGWAISKSFR